MTRSLHCRLVATDIVEQFVAELELKPLAPREQDSDRQDRGRRATAGKARNRHGGRAGAGEIACSSA